MRVKVRGLNKACKTLRRHTGWSQAKAAVECGTTAPTWSKYENQIVVHTDDVFVARFVEWYARIMGSSPVIEYVSGSSKTN